MVFLNQYSYLTFLLAKAPFPADPVARHAVSDLPHRHRRLFTERPRGPSLGAHRLLLAGE